MADTKDTKEKADEPFVSPNDVVDKDGVVRPQSPEIVGGRIAKMVAAVPGQPEAEPTSYRVAVTWQSEANKPPPHEEGKVLKAGDVHMPESSLAVIKARAKAQDPEHKDISDEEARKGYLRELTDIGALEPIYAKGDAPAPVVPAPSVGSAVPPSQQREPGPLVTPTNG